MIDNNSKKWKKAGRKPKLDPAVFRYSVKLNEMENARFLTRFELSASKIKAHFIKSCMLDKPIKTIRIDKSMSDYVMRLTQFYSQFRGIANNYNQIVKALKANFEEKKALALLYRLEQVTITLSGLSKEIVQLTKSFEERWLQK